MSLASQVTALAARVRDEFNAVRTALDTAHASLRAPSNMTGGGTLSVSSTGEVKWTTRFIVISNGKGAHFGSAGYFDIGPCPAAGTVITGVGTTDVTVTAAGVPLGSWQALYYILPIGSTQTFLAANLRVVYYTTDLVVPDNWVLVAIKGENSQYKFGNGAILPANSTWTVADQLPSKEAVANKSTATGLGTSNTLYPTQNAVKTYVDTGLALKSDTSHTHAGAEGVPAGAMTMFGGAAAPSGWLLCDGTAVSRTTYAALYAALGGASSPYGQGDGSTTFNLPDLRVRVPVGAGTGVALGSSDGLAEGSRDATRSHSHGHSSSGSSGTAGSHSHSGSSASTSTGGTHGHGFSQPSTALDGGHAHGNDTGNASLSSATNTALQGTGTRLTGPTSHSHSIVSGGGHTHSMSGGAVTNDSTGHSHSASVSIASDGSHSHTVSTSVSSNGSAEHAQLGVNFIIKT